MDMSDIKVGDGFSSVSKLYIKLGLDAKLKGTQKIAQDKEIARYLLYEKTGKINRNGGESNEIIITKVYNDILDKTDNRGGNNNKWSSLVKPLILIGNWNKPKTARQVYDDILGVFSTEIEFVGEDSSSSELMYNNEMFSKLRSIFKTSLNSLVKENKIMYDETYCYKKIGDTEEDEPHLANLIEKMQIEKLKDDLIIEMKITDYDLIYKPNVRLGFYKKLDSRYSSIGIFKAWKVFDVEINDNIITGDILANLCCETLENSAKIKENLCDFMQNRIVDYHYIPKQQQTNGFGLISKISNEPIYPLNNESVKLLHKKVFRIKKIEKIYEYIPIDKNADVIINTETRIIKVKI